MAFDDRQQWWDAADELSVRVRLAIVRISCGVRRPWFVQPPKAAFVHNDVPYTDALLQRAFSGRPEWQLAAHRDDPDRRLVLQIDEYEELPWERVLAGSIVANAYCVRKGLIRKANFAKHVAKHVAKRPASDLATSVPRTVVIETWSAFQDGDVAAGCFIDRKSALAACLVDAEEALAQHPSKLWVLKPSLANKGAEVTILRDAPALREQVQLWPDVREWVMQAYVDRPLLLARRKFHIRLYVLAVGALKVFMFHEALLLIAMHPYDADDIDDVYSHLTNTCVSVDHELFDESKFVRVFSDMPQLLQKQGVADPKSAARSIWLQMRVTMAHAFHSYQGEFSSFMPLPNAFELFGVDFLVDADNRVQLLEFNAGPDVKQTGDRLDYVIADMLRGMVDVVVDGGHFPALAREGPPSTPAGTVDGITVAPAGELPPHGWDLVYDQKWGGMDGGASAGGEASASAGAGAGAGAGTGTGGFIGLHMQ